MPSRLSVQEIQEQLGNATDRLEHGRKFFLAAMELLRDPRACYDQAGTSLKRAMNKPIFTKIFVDGEEITGHELTEAVSDVTHADWAIRTDRVLAVPQTPATPS